MIAAADPIVLHFVTLTVFSLMFAMGVNYSLEQLTSVWRQSGRLLRALLVIGYSLLGLKQAPVEEGVSTFKGVWARLIEPEILPAVDCADRKTSARTFARQNRPHM